MEQVVFHVSYLGWDTGRQDGTPVFHSHLSLHGGFTLSSVLSRQGRVGKTRSAAVIVTIGDQNSTDVLRSPAVGNG